MKVLVSLPVHEEPEVVHRQIRNLENFLEDPLVVLHVSAAFDVDPDSLATSPRVLINPERYPTGWGSGSCAKAHLSNLEHARRHAEFDYAVLASSNEMYVRRGLEQYLAAFEAGTTPTDFATWRWRLDCMRDRPLRRLLRRNGLDEPVLGQVEGSFFRRDILDRVLEAAAPLDRGTPWRDHRFGSTCRPLFMRQTHPLPYVFNRARKGFRWFSLRPRRPFGLHHLLELFLPRVITYPREEVYMPTALRTCRPERIGSCVTYMNWSKTLELSEAEIDAVRNGATENLPEGGSHPPDAQLFSVKRVPRDLEAPLRRHIESLSRGC